MMQYLKQFILRWLKRQFRGNPIVDQPGEYLPKVGQAISVGIVGGLIAIILGFLVFTIFIIGTLYGWY